jgi:hypothetical protein
MPSLRGAVLLALVLAACGGEEPAVVPEIEVQGAAIDGSEDSQPEPVVPDGTDLTVLALGSEEDASEKGDVGTEPEAGEGADSGLDEGAAGDVEESAIDEEESDGLISLTYQDLSLIDYDVDAMLDYMLFPEEYEGEDTSFLELPADLRALDGKQISIVGYMIPGEIQRGDVRDFMLVRDLMGCCFGGTPMADEWLDVTMDEEAEAEYRPYLPMRVTGILTLGGDQDEAGFALGIFRLQASEVEVED